MHIETVSSSDQIEMVEDLASEIWYEYFTPIIGQAQVEYMLARFQSRIAIAEQIERGFNYFLIRNDSDFIGYLAVLAKEKELFLSKLYIKSSERNKGYGRKVIQFLQQMAVDKGLGKISLTVNRHNSATIKAYEQFGFKNIGEVVQDIGNGFVMDDFNMEKVVQQG